MSDERRLRLVERVRQLPADQLQYVERLLDGLKVDGTLPPADGARAKGQGAWPVGAKPAAGKDWPHAPLHRLSDHGTYIVTGATLYKEHLFRGTQRLDLLESTLLAVMKEACWRLEAWAVFSNHYHAVAHAEPGAMPLDAVLKRLHGRTAIEVNRHDGVGDRPVWFNYWDTQLTYQGSYLARLNYVHQNAVKHALVPVANQYRWCSAAWFERTATRAQVHTIYHFRTDRIRIQDNFDPVV